MAKEKEDKTMYVEETTEEDEIPLFYSDIMPLLVSLKSHYFCYMLHTMS